MLKASTVQVRRILLIQLGASIVLPAVVLVIDPVLAWSALSGGMIATLANAYLGWKIFSRQQEAKPEQILAKFYGAEVGKIILTVMLFVAAIVMIKPLNIVALMGMYFLNTMIPWLASLFVDDDNQNWRA
ncbi:MAG: ATP synthase subunit I [Gammaproteobacteria bacterium]|nr:ATP synthase subunit I [Gammaproteobacteria bacterium]